MSQNISNLLSNYKNIWISSDFHFGHSNIVRGISTWNKGYRDFNTQQEHDETIIENINDRIMENDLLIQLGDFAFGKKEETVPYYRNKLKVKKIISIVGNHCKKKVLENVFGKENVFDIFEFKYKKRLLIMCHYPIDYWKEHDRGSCMLHGHKHLDSDKKFTGNRRMDVGLDGNNMKPYYLDDIIDILSAQPIGEGRHK